MAIIKINEKIIQRGKNDLYYTIEVFGKLKDKRVLYPRAYARILHETSIFKEIKKMDGSEWNDTQCSEYLDKVKKVIKLIDEIEKNY